MATRPNIARQVEAERARERETIEARARESDEARRARVSAIADSLTHTVLPNYPIDMIAGFNLFWGVTNNPRDTVEERLRVGYSIVQQEEIPEQHRHIHSSQAKQNNGQYGNAICFAEHILLKIPVQLKDDIMWYNHHDQPYSFYERMTEDATRNAQSKHHSGRVTMTDDMQADADKRYETPIFS